VLKKQFVAESAEINHNLAESTNFQIGLYRLLKRILLLDSARKQLVRAENSESGVWPKNHILATAAINCLQSHESHYLQIRNMRQMHRFSTRQMNTLTSIQLASSFVRVHYLLQSLQSTLLGRLVVGAQLGKQIGMIGTKIVILKREHAFT
jgi:hypothetical protein